MPYRPSTRWGTGLVPILLLTGSLLSCGRGDGGEMRPNPPAASPSVVEGAEALSLLGAPLFPPTYPTEIALDRAEKLSAAEAEYAASPESAEAAIWVGRRLAYLGRYREAIATFSKAAADHPDDARVYRHRGHRYITVREVDRAIADLERAALLIEGTPDEVEPDGLPNARGIPTSTLQFNIWYHLGLAHYVKGDYESALEAYQNCLRVATTDDSEVATRHWLYMTLRHLDRDLEAAGVAEAVDPEAVDVIENASYLSLISLYRGEVDPATLVPDDADASPENLAVAYGVGNWYLMEGERDRGLALFERMVALEGAWASFGYLAAEAELARGN